MIQSLTQVRQSAEASYFYSVIIPTWNNLPYLKACVEGLVSNSGLPFEIVVVVNDGTDGTQDFLKSLQISNLTVVHSPVNLGVCFALNVGRSYIKSEHIIYMNDDMYPLPLWDNKLIHAFRKLGSDSMVSATMVEPIDTGNKCVIVADYGKDITTFRRKEAETASHKLKKEDWLGSTWPPNLLHKNLWDLVGGMSVEFSPGFGSDPDLTMKLYKAGIRKFYGVGSSLVYHFGSKSTSKIQKNPGKELFEAKWGMKRSTFLNEIVKRGLPTASNTIADSADTDNSLGFKARRVISILKG